MSDFVGNVFDEYKLSPEVIPSPGTQDREWSQIEQKIEIAKHFTNAIHIDICDGKFAPNTTFLDPAPFAKYTQDLFFEVHLMVEDPESYIDRFAAAGFKRFIGHIEKMPDISSFVAKAQLVGEVGLGLDSSTPLATLQISFDDIDVLLLMTVKAGFSGQAFMPEMLEKITQARNASESLPIEIDGGVNESTIFEARLAGANRFVTTKYVFDSASPESSYHKLLEIIS